MLGQLSAQKVKHLSIPGIEPMHFVLNSDNNLVLVAL